MELNREQIIKELEGLVNFTTCPEYIKNALSLIKELTEEKNKVFEAGARNLSRLELSYLTLEVENAKLTEENERLRGCVKSKEEVETIMRATYEPLVKEIAKEQIDKATADTVRKMQERLKAKANENETFPYGGYIHFGDAIIYLTATLLPAPYAIAAAAIGGGLADLLTAPMWILPTIIIKMLIVR